MKAIDRALAAREALLADPDTDVARLCNGRGDGIDGLVIEKLGPVLIAQLHLGRLTITEDAARALCQHAADRVGATAVYRKLFPKDRSFAPRDLDRLHNDPTPWAGAPSAAEIVAREAGATYLVHPYDGYATGLFLDHRHQRAHVRTAAAGRRVLNTFAYTCAFSVVAGLAGAAGTVSVDISRKYLEWGKRNFAANDLPLEPHRFICSDVFDYYKRAARQGHRFDLVILDPPTFARMKRPRRTFVLTEDLEQLVQGAVSLLDPGGLLHLSVNHRGTSEGRLRRAIREAAGTAGRRIAALRVLPLPEDFAGDPEQAKAVVAQLQ